jgi:hypothetical protein
MTRLIIPYETLIRYDASGQFLGAHQQMREVFLDANGDLLTERLLPAVPFGSDPAFPASSLLGQTAESAIASATAATAEAAAAAAVRDAAIIERNEAIAARDAAIAEKAAAEEAIAQLQAQIAALTTVPERPAGKWWENAAAFLGEFTPEETLAISRSDVPLISKLLMTLLAWPGEIWAADQRIQDGLQALVATEVLTEARRQAILT